MRQGGLASRLPSGAARARNLRHLTADCALHSLCTLRFLPGIHRIVGRWHSCRTEGHVFVAFISESGTEWCESTPWNRELESISSGDGCISSTSPHEMHASCAPLRMPAHRLLRSFHSRSTAGALWCSARHASVSPAYHVRGKASCAEVGLSSLSRGQQHVLAAPWWHHPAAAMGFPLFTPQSWGRAVGYVICSTECSQNERLAAGMLPLAAVCGDARLSRCPSHSHNCGRECAKCVSVPARQGSPYEK